MPFGVRVFFVLLVLGITEARAQTESPPGPGYLINDHGAVSSFDWQEAWGTIHLNSDADGLLDPGHASTDGTVRIPCRPGSDVCEKARAVDLTNSLNYVSKLDVARVGNGIKYDIKNSVLNCMSKVVPNSPIFNGGDAAPYATNQCAAAGVKRRDGNRNNLSSTDHPYSLIYLPLWDTRGADGSNNGCQRQVINNCVQDIHDCGIGHDGTSEGTKFPTTHVFTKSEVEGLCGAGNPGCQMPVEYWRKKEGDKWVLSATEPVAPAPVTSPSPTSSESSGSSVSAGNSSESGGSTGSGESSVASWEKIENKKDPILERIKVYKTDLHPSFSGDVQSFYVVDPSDFFDMRHYVQGGKYDSGYSEIIGGVPVAQDTCPILGTGGYNGICDPTGVAGCNLPIYGVGAHTNFTDKFGNVTTSVNYPVKWSGYVKNWKVISKAQYLINTSHRKNLNGGNLYAGAGMINDNPIFMVLRADSFCDNRERFSGRVQQKTAPDLPCIQYKQYQRMKDDTGANFYSFVDLFQPDADIGIKDTHSLSTLATRDSQGRPVTKFEPGKVPSESNPAVAASFLDTYMPRLGLNTPAISRSDYETRPPQSTHLNSRGERQTTIGDQLRVGRPGTGFKLESGQKVGLRLFPDSDPEKMKNPFNPDGYAYGTLADKSKISTRCAIVDRTPAGIDQPKAFENRALFVPTNTQAELDSFVHASADAAVANAHRTVDGAKAISCDASFQTFEQANGWLNSTSQQPLVPAPVNAVSNPKGTWNPNKTLTWIGTTSCSQLTTQPTCNESRIITAQRYCLLSDGVQGSCGDCIGAGNPDSDVDFSLAAVAGTRATAEIMSDMRNPNTCFFKAACFAVASAGCPTTKTGGHIFCVSADTKIAMADGSQKEIAKIKAGEKVLSFSDVDFKERPFAAKVHSVAVTEDQTTLNVSFGKGPHDVLKITAEHKVVLSTGRAIEARDLLEGDEILRANGKLAVVRKLEYSDERITVYNLVLEEGAEGYMANGLRVLSYPLSQEMIDAARSQRASQ